MPQDAFTLRYLALELNNIFEGSKINRIVAPSNDEVVFTAYNGKRTYKLLIDVNPSCPRIGVVDEEKPSPLTAPNFCMLLRKHLLSATLDNISIVGFDRIIRIDFTSSSEFFDGVKKTLFIELMGRYSNIILTENGNVLGGNRGINMFDDGVRPLFVGSPYVFPPNNGKLLPSDSALIESFSKTLYKELPEFICKNVQGIALSTAEKCVKDYTDRFSLKGEDICNGKEFFVFFNEFLFNSKINPVVVKRNGEIFDVCVFKYNESDDIIAFENLFSAENYYFTEKGKLKEFLDKKSRALSSVNSAIKKAKRRLSQINGRISESEDLEKNKLFGELLIANLYKFKDRAKSVSVENYYDNNNIIEIPLDENLSVKDNAEKYYKKYNKQKRSLTLLEPQKNMAKEDVEYFESLLSLINLSENTLDIDCVISELEENGILKVRNVKVKKQNVEKPYRLYNIDGFKVKVGRNNIENDKLTFSSNKENLWIHAKDYHSTHIIIEVENKKVPDSVIITACEICAFYSKGRNAGKVEIVVTEKKNVKKPPKSKLGFVTYTNFVSYVVKPEKHQNLLAN